MAGIGTEAHSVADLFTDQGVKGGEFLECASEGGPATGGGFQQHADGSGHRKKRSSVRGSIAGKSGTPAVDIVARVRHQIRYAERFAPPKLRYERRLGAST